MHVVVLWTGVAELRRASRSRPCQKRTTVQVTALELLQLFDVAGGGISDLGEDAFETLLARGCQRIER